MDNIELIPKLLFKTKYLLCNAQEYALLNEMISAASGYPDATGTSIYAPIIPQMTQETFVVDPDGMVTDVVLAPSMCVLPIISDLQEFRPEFFDGLELVDSFSPKLEDII